MKIPAIETTRLLLRGFTKEDALWAFRIWNDPEVGKYLPDEPMLEPDPEYIRELEELGDDEECCYLIPVMKEHPEQRVGTCSFLPLDEGKTYDLAYCVHPYFWKQGYATEMAQGMIEYARRQGAEKATIWVSTENAASCRVAEKCGGIAATEKTYHKRNTDLVMKEIRYDITL